MNNPYENDESPVDVLPDPCDACGFEIETGETYVRLGDLKIHGECAALCCGCSELGVAKDMLRIGAAHWVHEDCVAAPDVIYERYQAHLRDEWRDDFNETRR